MKKTLKSHFMLLSCTAVLCGYTLPAHSFSSQTTLLQNSAHPSLLQINATSESEAKDFITNLTQEGIEFLSNKELSDEDRAEKFRVFLTKSFDMKTIGRFVLGRNWRVATPEQQKEYLQLFEDMIVGIYARRFGEYDGQTINVTGSRPEGKRDVTVTSAIVSGGSTPDIQVDWRVRKNKEGALKVIDVSVEGVSMSLTQRSDFSSVIQRGGGKIEVLLEHLRKAVK